jgi:hypothetical protein
LGVDPGVVVVLPGVELLLSLEPLVPPLVPPGGVGVLLLVPPGGVAADGLLSLPPAAPGVAGDVPEVPALGGVLGVLGAVELGGVALGAVPAGAPELLVLPVLPPALPASFFSHAPSANMATSAASNTGYFIWVPLRKYSCKNPFDIRYAICTWLRHGFQTGSGSSANWRKSIPFKCLNKF